PRRASSSAATRPFPSAVSPPLSTRFASPASTTSALSPSPSPPARVPNNNDYCRRQFDGPHRGQTIRGPEPPAVPHLLDHHACQPGRRHHRLRLYSIPRKRVGWRRGKARRHQSDFGQRRGNPNAQRIRRHREQGGRSHEGPAQRRASETARAENRRHKNPKIHQREASATIAPIQNSRKQDPYSR